MAKKGTQCWLVDETILCTPISVPGWKTAVDAALIRMWEKDYSIPPWSLLHFLGLPLPFQQNLSCKPKKAAPNGPSKLGDLVLLKLVDNVIIKVNTALILCRRKKEMMLHNCEENNVEQEVSKLILGNTIFLLVVLRNSVWNMDPFSRSSHPVAAVDVTQKKCEGCCVC